MMKKTAPFSFLMISAMYENGGNTTHRLLDGHPELFVYPFESQPGTKYVNDYLSSMYPLKYRWPVFPMGVSAEDAYELIIDEEAKVRLKTPFVSKFRDADFQMTDAGRKKDFVSFLKGKELTRGLCMEAFFRASFSAWKNYPTTGKEKAYVGYSPIIGIDGDKILKDIKGAIVLHITRNPFSAYADTKKRAVPLALPHYMTGWMTSQYFAKLYEAQFPGRFFVVRFEDIVKNPRTALKPVLTALRVKDSDTLTYPSWKGTQLTEVYPWGTVRTPTEKANIETAKELSKQEVEEIYIRTKSVFDIFDYEEIYRKIR